MQLMRLRGRKVAARVRAKGRLWRGKHMRISYLMMSLAQRTTNVVGEKHKMRNAKPESALYVGIAASTKLHKSAVKRNRMRRRCREALRVTLQPNTYNLSPSIQLLISPRSSSLTCDFAELRQDAQNFLNHLLTVYRLP